MTQSTVATPSSAVTAMQPDWELSRALLGGTRAMRAAGKKFLPQWPNEEDAAYDARLGTAVLFPAYKRTVETLAGKPFSKPLTLGDDVPPEIEAWAEDIDLEGRNLHVFAADLMESALGYGLCGILVDCPKAEGIAANAAGVPTKADEQRAGVRPYFVHIKPWQILGWVAKREGGNWVLKMLRLMECVEEPDGEFGTKDVEQVRVLRPGAFDVYRKQKDAKGNETWALQPELSGLTSLGYIPFVPMYGKRTGYMMAEPPLKEVAHLNVQHWQSASDQQTILHVARVPILAVMGVEDGFDRNGKPIPWQLTIGASSAVRLPKDGDLKFVEHTGAAIQAGTDDLKALEERMRQAGAELLVIDQKLTATQVTTENAVGMCALQRIVQTEEDVIDQALQMMADWMGLQESGHVTIFNDFGAATLDDASAQLIVTAQQGGLISKETAINELKRRGKLGADVEAEEEAAKIAEEGPALGMLGDPQQQQQDPSSDPNPNPDPTA
jgi:hypothetical protein